ncbi:MAG: type II toxin-antitoxin system PrlF family antitoxin [Pseudomonadota bacterium]|nr:type II toxin-antitoxin system PrlF family antitoxin [Pseudomonadota bacterium]
MSRPSRNQSTLTDRYQTTIPEFVREALHLQKRDKISYIIQEDGKVLLFRANEEDPVLSKMLTFLAEDIEKHPTHIRTVSATLVQHARSLVENVEINLDVALSDEDD